MQSFAGVLIGNYKTLWVHFEMLFFKMKVIKKFLIETA